MAKTTKRIPVYNYQTQRRSTAAYPKFYHSKLNRELLSVVVRAYLSNQRQAQAKTKSRGEIVTSTRKIWRQKGTGRARHGDRGAPIFVKGGVAHGPTGQQNYRKKINQKQKRLALAQALSYKISKKRLVLLKSIDRLEGKTKQAAELLNKLEIKGKTLLLYGPQLEDKPKRAFRNLDGLSLQSASNVNVYQVLSSQWVLITPEALSYIEEHRV